MKDYAVLALAWAGWCLLHSLLAAASLTAGQERVLGTIYRRFYRLFYNVFSAVSFVYVLQLQRYDMRQLLGLARLCGGSGRGLGEGGGVDTGGILGLVRHPWYLAMLLLLWARNLQTADLVVNTVLMLYLVGGTVLEERKLVAAFGAEYRAYQQRVSMLVPWKALKAWMQRPNSGG